jgi:hypothetical protein
MDRIIWRPRWIPCIAEMRFGAMLNGTGLAKECFSNCQTIAVPLGLPTYYLPSIKNGLRSSR